MKASSSRGLTACKLASGPASRLVRSGSSPAVRNTSRTAWPCKAPSITSGNAVRGAIPDDGCRNALQQQAAALHAVHQRLRTAAVLQAAFVHQQHFAAQLGLVQIGGAPQHRHAAIGQTADHAPQLAARDGVHSDTGFIQQQDARRTQQGAGQPQFLFHAAGQLAGQPVGKAGQIGKRQQAFKAFRPRRPVTPRKSAYR
jgi:hypothetical protein